MLRIASSPIIAPTEVSRRYWLVDRMNYGGRGGGQSRKKSTGGALPYGDRKPGPAVHPLGDPRHARCVRPVVDHRVLAVRCGSQRDFVPEMADSAHKQ